MGNETLLALLTSFYSGPNNIPFVFVRLRGHPIAGQKLNRERLIRSDNRLFNGASRLLVEGFLGCFLIVESALSSTMAITSLPRFSAPF
jgi:hypothetical protein